MRPSMLTALIVATALFMENMDGTVISTSLPAIAHDLNQDPIVLKLALTSYMLTLAVFIPASGWIADRFGARTVFCSAIVVFTLGSILCGASTSLETLIAARVFQGLGGAMMVPVGRLVLLRSVEKSDLVDALAYLTVPALLGPVAGPPLGGFITTYFHWRWIFWINVPIGLLGVALSLRYVANLREEVVPRFDFKGFVLSGVGLLGLISGLSLIGRGMAPGLEVAAQIAVSLVLLGLYVRHAGLNEDAILDLRLLKIPTFFAGVAGGLIFRIGIGALPFLLPLLLQIGFGLTPFESGSMTFATALGAMAMKFTASTALRRFGFRRTLIVNAAVSGLFMASYALFTAGTPHWLIFLALLAGGFFRSLEFTALNALSYADIDPPRMSRATSFASVAQQMSGAIGVAVAAVCIQLIQVGFGDATLHSRDLSLSFVAVAVVSSLSMLVFIRLKPEAGDSLAARAPASEEATAAAE
ncbi:EmrB/QacA subfamily drug resistance transporter [Roseiarcus fermentans]|uniref:EmrB/QacA subfamily drug resistance transporter n=1 Tax=Roseiarcus fermentans TaxID=1473586 RepID=A0A366FDN8_9HYPH|nr:MFS transporter [Roseiarcus fermentans]RBP12206.1 EmrB/QacA subfamily drug resistance transporter [Roseiarcus fermentans]